MVVANNVAHESLIYVGRSWICFLITHTHTHTSPSLDKEVAPLARQLYSSGTSSFLRQLVSCFILHIPLHRCLPPATTDNRSPHCPPSARLPACPRPAARHTHPIHTHFGQSHKPRANSSVNVLWFWQSCMTIVVRKWFQTKHFLMRKIIK